MNQDYTILVSGGNNYLENLKVKMEKDFPSSSRFFNWFTLNGTNIQDGRRELFETAVLIGEPEADITIEAEEVDLDGLNYLAGKGMVL